MKRCWRWLTTSSCSLGDGYFSLSEFLIGNQRNAQCSLTWALENGVLKLEEFWSEALENKPVTLTRTRSLPHTKPARAPTTAAKSVARRVRWTGLKPSDDQHP